MGGVSRVCAATVAFIVCAASAPSMNDILVHSPKEDWHAVNPANTLVMALPHGRVTIQLAPAFAPNTITNIRKLVHAHYFDGSFVVRAQDNYVVQWARTDSRSLGTAQKTIPAEFDRSAASLSFRALPDPDTYARETGFSFGFPAARDSANGRIWLAHCYGMVGVGRDVAADSGNGGELYAVIGQSPRTVWPGAGSSPTCASPSSASATGRCARGDSRRLSKASPPSTAPSSGSTPIWRRAATCTPPPR